MLIGLTLTGLTSGLTGISLNLVNPSHVLPSVGFLASFKIGVVSKGLIIVGLELSLAREGRLLEEEDFLRIPGLLKTLFLIAEAEGFFSFSILISKELISESGKSDFGEETFFDSLTFQRRVQS